MWKPLTKTSISETRNTRDTAVPCSLTRGKKKQNTYFIFAAGHPNSRATTSFGCLLDRTAASTPEFLRQSQESGQLELRSSNRLSNLSRSNPYPTPVAFDPQPSNSKGAECSPLPNFHRRRKISPTTKSRNRRHHSPSREPKALGTKIESCHQRMRELPEPT